QSPASSLSSRPCRVNEATVRSPGGDARTTIRILPRLLDGGIHAPRDLLPDLRLDLRVDLAPPPLEALPVSQDRQDPVGGLVGRLPDFLSHHPSFLSCAICCCSATACSSSSSSWNRRTSAGLTCTASVLFWAL